MMPHAAVGRTGFDTARGLNVPPQASRVKRHVVQCWVVTEAALSERRRFEYESCSADLKVGATLK
jgi:hypothetical protein